MMSWEWEPLVRVGPFRFGEQLDASSTDLAKLPRDESDQWDSYRVGDEEARVHVEGDKVTAVECVRSLLFEGKELIGLTIESAARVLKTTPSLSKTWKDGDQMWEVESLGLALWLEDGVVESATVGPLDEDED